MNKLIYNIYYTIYLHIYYLFLNNTFQDVFILILYHGI